MGLTADNLVDALTVCAGGESAEFCSGGVPDDEFEVVLMLRHAQPTFAPTVYSAWEAEGRELSPMLQSELDSARARVDYYRSVDAAMRAQVPGLDSVKGLEIIDLYPNGLARHQNDLDYVASGEDDLWDGCRHLLGTGWEVDTATFSVVKGAVGVMVSMRRPNEDPYQMVYGVELTTYYSLGNYGAINPLLGLPQRWRGTAIKNILMLLYERYEQPFRARDLVDTVLLHNELSRDELAELHRAVVELSLGVEYAELVELVGKTGLGPLPAWPGRRLATGTIRARRSARAASFFLRPVAGTGRQLQRRMITGQIGSLDGALWDAVQRRLTVPQALSGGLIAFGLPLDRPPPVTRTVLRRRGRLAWADTPVARFLLTVGDYVSQGDVDELASEDTARAAELAAESRT